MSQQHQTVDPAELSDTSQHLQKSWKDKYLEELEQLRNLKLKALLKEIVREDIPNYFWTVPSSASGKFHPADEVCEGGLVMHTLRCVQAAKILSPLYQLTDAELDLVIAALLLHDICKNGSKIDSGHTVFLHPQFAADSVVLAAGRIGDFETRQLGRKLARLICTHMGCWNVDPQLPSFRLPRPKTPLQKFVHLCDYVASRKDICIALK